MWLVKTEPDTFSIQDLQRAHIAPWDGVRNYQARNFIRDQMQLNDPVLIYHSSCKQPAIVGLAKVHSPPFEDLSAKDPNSPYYDAKAAQAAQPRWYAIELQFCEIWQPISLNILKQTLTDPDFVLLRQGHRLSVMPVPQRSWQHIQKLRQSC